MSAGNIKMALEFIKHSREVTTEQLQKYGKYATHDILAPIILLYPVGTIPDKNGIQVKIDDAFIQSTMNATNSAIKKKFNNPLAKAKSFFTTDVNKYEVIPIIKNHKTDDVDSTSGYTQGLAYMQDISGVKCLLINGLIKDAETKSKIAGDIFRYTSLGTRPDGSIKEISIVSNEALSHGGFVMSEQDNNIDQQSINNNNPSLNEQELMLSEKITELKLQEQTITSVTIPNHMVLSRMIKNGKIEPYKYDELINQSTNVVELMEKSLPSNKLGVMIGTKRHPEKVQLSQEQVSSTVVSKAVSEFWTNNPHLTPKNDNVKQEKSQINVSQMQFNAIKQDMYFFEETRKNELKHILELAEYSPDVMVKYIAHELGEDVQATTYSDKYLSEYIEQAKQLKTEINNLEIQLGELN